MSNEFVFATLPTRSSAKILTGLKFPVIVMPVKSPLEYKRIHITGGGAKSDEKIKLSAWDMDGQPYKRLGSKLRDQLNRVFDNIDIHLTLDAFISHDEDGQVTLVVHDAMPTLWHLDGTYTCTLQDRLTSLDDFLGRCSANKRNRIFGAKRQVFYNWDELFVALFEVFEGHQGLCTLFPFASIRSFNSVYTVNEDPQWVVASGDEVMEHREAITEAWEASEDTFEADLQKWVIDTQKRLDDGYIKTVVLPEGFSLVDGKITDTRDHDIVICGGQ